MLSSVSLDDILSPELVISHAPINISPQRGAAGDTMGIRHQNNPSPRELDKTSSPKGNDRSPASQNVIKMFWIVLKYM